MSDWTYVIGVWEYAWIEWSGRIVEDILSYGPRRGADAVSNRLAEVVSRALEGAAWPAGLRPRTEGVYVGVSERRHRGLDLAIELRVLCGDERMVLVTTAEVSERDWRDNRERGRPIEHSTHRHVEALREVAQSAAVRAAYVRAGRRLPDMVGELQQRPPRDSSRLMREFQQFVPPVRDDHMDALAYSIDVLAQAQAEAAAIPASVLLGISSSVPPTKTVGQLFGELGLQKTSSCPKHPPISSLPSSIGTPCLSCRRDADARTRADVARISGLVVDRQPLAVVHPTSQVVRLEPQADVAAPGHEADELPLAGVALDVLVGLGQELHEGDGRASVVAD